MDSLSVIIADDHEIVRQGVRTSLERMGFQVIADAQDGLEAIDACKRLKPDVLVLDFSMPKAGANEVIEEVRRFSPSTRVLILTGVTNASVLQPLVQLDIMGIVLKDSPVATMEQALGADKPHETFLDPALELILKRADHAILSKRELQVLGLLLRGNSNSEVASLLNVSPNTVSNHRTSIMRKLDAHSVVELMMKATKLGLIDPEIVGDDPAG